MHFVHLFLKYGYLPKSFMHSVIVPLIKNISGDLSDMNNYRAIAISIAYSKIFETTMSPWLHSDSAYNKYQFGFKSVHSTSLCDL